jgi:hypothetical protein
MMTQQSMFDQLYPESDSLPVVLLVDNGSRRAQAVLGLRKLAAELSGLMSLPVEPVSLLHSHKISADALEGEPAMIVRERLSLCAARGESHVVIIPAFIGPSLAITEYLPKVVAEAREDYPDLRVTIADTLCGSDPHRPDERLAQILFEHVLAIGDVVSGATVAVVDHGSPIQLVTTVRNALAQQLAKLCQQHALTRDTHVLAASMERRDGPKYAFNEPLLQNIQPQASHAQHCITAMLFLLPGRHAGEGGDVADICADMVNDGLFAKMTSTALLSEHPLLALILQDRFVAVYQTPSSREANISAYLHFTRHTLPALAQRITCDWPVGDDHCFQRIVLDNVCQGVWHHTLKKPACQHLDTAQAQQAVALCRAICADKVDLHQLNHNSLRWREKTL